MEYYKIIASEEHLKAIILALESYARLGIGQLEVVLSDLGFNHNEQFKDKMSTFHCDEEYKKAIEIAKYKIFDQSFNGSMSIHNDKVDDNFKICWEIYQSIRSKLAWDKNPEGGLTVDFDRPTSIADKGLIKIEVVEQEVDDVENKTD